MIGTRLACATARERVVDVGGLRLHLLEWAGTDAPEHGLIFLHGGSAHAHWFDAVIGPFAGRHHVVSLDQRGHGQSDWPSTPAYATQDFVGDLLGVVDALGWRRAVVVGHSMGGHNAMAFAARHPDRVRALVIVDSRPAIPEERLGHLRSRGARATRRPHPSRADAVATFRLVPRETVADPALLQHMAEAGVVEREGGWVYRFDPDANRMRRPADNWPVLARVTAPTLVLRAALSPVLPADQAGRICALVRSATLVEIPGAYHHVTLDQPARVAAALADFLETIG
jgi:pimeloyl-ACP methyl ester carboxylesterase